jgi:hypothetical protein
VKTKILNISENNNLSAVTWLPDADILKQLKAKFQGLVTSISLTVTVLNNLSKSLRI